MGQNLDLLWDIQQLKLLRKRYQTIHVCALRRDGAQLGFILYVTPVIPVIWFLNYQNLQITENIETI